MKCLKEAIFMISPKLKLTVLEQLKERMEELYKTYKEPELDKDGKLINKKLRKMKKAKTVSVTLFPSHTTGKWPRHQRLDRRRYG